MANFDEKEKFSQQDSVMGFFADESKAINSLELRQKALYKYFQWASFKNKLFIC